MGGRAAWIGVALLVGGALGVAAPWLLSPSPPSRPSPVDVDAVLLIRATDAEEGLRMIAERTQCLPGLWAMRDSDLWVRLQVLAGCAHRQERRIDDAERALGLFREADALERAYWAHLARAGLTRRIEHVPVRP